ncbi:methionyl-tRNA formyltransferase [Solobacterium moorei]|uniref:methionyl-tRNA formyltransferase n=1 Tax=Solobacterium moorei TaxID=102148 RepID=UPI0003FD333A|nr:methionyl-tRNA formyltransferase [Solobacterium moorei]BET21551.1 methionyl-tRNA formyltransferase [Solobacterium moorei]
MKQIRIIFFGTTEFASGILQTLIDEGYNVVAVVSQPDKPVGRKHTIQMTPIHVLADQCQIPVIQPDLLKEHVDDVLRYEPELILTCAYGQFVPVRILEYPRYGCINVHPSLLPKYRGGAPIHHAVMGGETETGVSLIQMTKAMDAGDIYARVTTPLGKDETMAELNQRLLVLSKQLVKDNLEDYIAGKLVGEPQDDNKVILGLNITKEEEKVQFAVEDVQTLYNHIRGLIDWPMPYGVVGGKRMKFCKVRMRKEDHQVKPGEILGFKNHAMEVASIGGIIEVYELQPEGKSRMTADAYANGAGRNMIGKVFE